MHKKSEYAYLIPTKLEGNHRVSPISIAVGHVLVFTDVLK